MRPEIVEQAGVEERAYGGAVRQLACLPGVERQWHGVIGEGQVSGETGGELLRVDGAALLGPGRVGGEHGPVDGHPVEGEGAAQFGCEVTVFGVGEPFAALGCGVEGVAEEEGLFGGEEKVGAGGAGGSSSVGEEVGRAAGGVGDSGDQFGALALARLAAEERGDGDGVGGRGVRSRALQEGQAEAVPAGGRPVAHGDEQGGTARVERDPEGVPVRPGDVALPDPAAQKVLHGRGVRSPPRVRVVEMVELIGRRRGGGGTRGGGARCTGVRVRRARGQLAGHRGRAGRHGPGRRRVVRVGRSGGLRRGTADDLGCVGGGGGVHGRTSW